MSHSFILSCNSTNILFNFFILMFIISHASSNDTLYSFFLLRWVHQLIMLVKILLNLLLNLVMNLRMVVYFLSWHHNIPNVLIVTFFVAISFVFEWVFLQTENKCFLILQLCFNLIDIKCDFLTQLINHILCLCFGRKLILNFIHLFLHLLFILILKWYWTLICW